MTGINQVKEMRSALAKGGLHNRSPWSVPDRSKVNPHTGRAHFIRATAALPPADLAKGYVPVVYSGPDHGIRVAADGSSHRFEYAQSKLRPGARPRSEDSRYSDGAW